MRSYWKRWGCVRPGPGALLRLAVLLVGALVLVAPPGWSAKSPQPPSRPVALNLDKLPAAVRAHISGVAAMELDPRRDRAAVSTGSTGFFRFRGDGCPADLGDNVKVNQNCLNVSDPALQGRGQSQNETAIAADPSNPAHLVAGYNDYRRGDGQCGTSFSRDGGWTWTDASIPMGFTDGSAFGAARQYWEAGGDTSVAFDSRGNAYFDCMVFQRGTPLTINPDLSSALVVFRSTGTGGASWNFPGRYVTIGKDVTGASTVLTDKPYLTVDSHVSSPNRDRVYVTWTQYDLVHGTAYIEESFSSDFGEHFSTPIVVTPTSATAACPFPIKPGAGCDNNQFSQPLIGADGALYVAWSNFNTVDFSVAKPGPAKYQVLLAKSSDGGQSFGAPVKVADYYELPDCATYQGKNAGRVCVPEKGGTANSYFRAANYPSAAIDPHDPNRIAVTFGSYLSRDSNESNGCVATGSDPNSSGGLYTGVKVAGACSNHILVSISRDGGATFDGGGKDVRKMTPVVEGAAQARTDQWFQWAGFTLGGQMVVSFYDRQYDADETSGFSDVSLASSRDLADFEIQRVTSSSNPPPTQFSGNFIGDYTGLAVSLGSVHPVWSDTRAKELFVCPGTGTGPGNPPQLCGLTDSNGEANQQNIFTVGLPAF